MSETKRINRLTTLTTWAQRATASGFLVPEDDELREIATDPNQWAQRLTSPVSAAWAATIDHLLHQVKFGVNPAVAVEQLPDELHRPNGDAALPATTARVPRGKRSRESARETETIAPDTRDDLPDVVEALVNWRAARIADGAEGADLIKDVTLKNLVKFGYTDAAQIGRKLPGPAAYLGTEIAAIIGGFGGEEAAADSPGTATRRATDARRAAHAAVTPQDSPSPVTDIRSSEFDSASPWPQRSDDALLSFTHSDFSEYEYGESPVSLAPVTIRSALDGRRLTYEPFAADAGKLVVYRVVSGDDVEPYKPEVGELVAATTALQVEDNRDLVSAVRHYQVWCHVGVDLEDARRNQPFLLAKGEEVSPVDGFIVTEDEGRVIGQWSVHPGTRAVRVYRIPLEGTGPRSNDPQNRICADQANLTGFVDTEAERGTRYLYRAEAEVSVGSSVQLSRPRQQEILVSVILTGIDDLDIVVSDDHSEFDLSWTTPGNGKVHVYRSETPPQPGLEGSEMPEAALALQGFNEESRIKHPVTATPDPLRSGMKGVPWPARWERIYLTPVTTLAGAARVGVTQVETRPLPPVANPEIVERFDAQVVRFGWPAGAAAVQAFVGGTSTSPEEIVANGQPWAEINAAHYRRDGGFIFPRRLTPIGCTVCLTPVNYSRGELVRGQISALHYAGLHRMRYQLTTVDDPARDIRMLWLDTELDIDSTIVLVMVNRLDRFPLSADDGDPVYFLPADGGEASRQCLIAQLPRGSHHLGWHNLTGLRGFFRLFIAEASDRSRRYALVDPSMDQLYVLGAGGDGR